MRTLAFVGLVAAALSCGACSVVVTARLYPVKGPFSEQRPLPVIKATVKDVQRNTGEVSLSLPDGELCKGTWSSIAPRQVSATTFAGSGQVSAGLRSAYATVYGTGFTVSNVPGVNRGTAFLVGDRGTTVEVEFFTGSGTANGNGVAADSKGNTYKVIF